jgi:hypothetical protein
MPVPVDQQKLAEALRALGVMPHSLDAIRRAPFSDAQRLMQELKDQAKKAYRKLSLELHPDRTGNDPEKTAQFTFLGNVLADIQKLEVRPPAPVMPRVQFQVQVPFGARPGVTTAGNVPRTTNANTTTTGPQPIYVVFMRP